MHDLKNKVLSMFEHLRKDVLDLPELFEAGGNDPDARAAVVDTVDRLAKEGLLEERGNDFYALTAKGKKAVN
jgi:DNA-binding PadR family transcriptional regulator